MIYSTHVINVILLHFSSAPHIILLSCCFALVSPTIVEEPVICVEDGRHPVVDLLLTEGRQYVPNSTDMRVRTNY